MRDHPDIAGQQAWTDWLATAPGRYLLDWAQRQIDEAVGDVFGYHAIQLGFSNLQGLRSNRMPSRVLALTQAESIVLKLASIAGVAGVQADHQLYPGCAVAGLPPGGGSPATADGETTQPLPGSTVIVERFEELPFAEQSVDLVVLPHVLEFAQDPHQVLREVDRVLRPEGRVIIVGLNPISLWGARQAVGDRLSQPFLPGGPGLIGLPRLRDWLKLLSFELDRSRYGCYRPACSTSAWLARTEFMEQVGDRLWPICGAGYVVSAVKRVRGMRLIGAPWKREAVPGRRVAVAASRFQPVERPADRASR